jgi:cellulose synthase/poly-beta-1,6-N-acetylglucosamine synthase-like glycosyltransferase
MLLSQRGWKRLYVENAAILTGGPESLRKFLGQRLRWSRGLMLHRVLDAGYIANEGPITAWYMIRTAFYDVIVFAWIAYYAITGHVLFPVSRWDLLVQEVLPAIYNYLRTPTPLPNLIKIVFLYTLYRITLPFIRTYTFITPLNTAWALPSSTETGTQFKLVRLMKQEHEGLAFSAWVAILAAAIARGGSSYMALDDNTMWTAVCSSMVVGWSLAAYSMFAK